MSRSKKRKPKSPEDVMAAKLASRRQDMEAVGLPPEAANLPTHDDIEITRKAEKRDGKVVEENSARRLDAFEALKPTMAPGCYDAARRLERDMLIRRGEADRGKATGRVDHALDLDHARALTMIEAGDRVDEVLARLGDRDLWLLTELITGHLDRPQWRQTVAHITGEHQANAQGAAVRAATVNLRDAYVAIERKAAA